MTSRTVLIPDLNEDLSHALAVLEEVLLSLAAGEDDEPDPPLPAPLSGRVALQAVHRLWDVLTPTQGQRAIKAGLTGRLLAPGWPQYEHVPLRLVEVDQADVDTLAAAARALGDPHAEHFIRETIEDLAPAQLGQLHDRDAAQELVMRVAQLAGVLDLADTAQAALLRGRLVDVDPATDIVLTAAEEDAYQATVTRINAMWTLGDGLHRWQY